MLTNKSGIQCPVDEPRLSQSPEKFDQIEVLIDFTWDQSKTAFDLLNGSFAVAFWYLFLRVRILTFVDFYD